MRGGMGFRGTISVLMVGLTMVALPASGQEERFREISPGFSDVNPSMHDGLFRPVDLRTPLGFERLYEIVDSGGLFARRAGAVTAVFDRSVYLGDATPLVPPGTVFYVGDLPVDLARPGLFAPAFTHESGGVSASPYRMAQRVIEGAADTSRGSLAADARVDLRVGSPSAMGTKPVEPRGTMWTSESHRRRRVGELIRGAAWRWRQHEAASAR